MENNVSGSDSFLTITDVAKRLNVKRSWVRSMVFKGEIPFLKIGRHVRFDNTNIEKWIADRNPSLSAKGGSYE